MTTTKKTTTKKEVSAQGERRREKFFDFSEKKPIRAIIIAACLINVSYGILVFFSRIYSKEVNFWLFAILILANALAMSLVAGSAKAKHHIASVVILATTILAGCLTPIYTERYNKSDEIIQCIQAPCFTSTRYANYYGFIIAESE